MERCNHAPLLVELIAGRVVGENGPVALSDKELQLVILLASGHAAVTRERIGETLWPHLGDERWAGNLKTTVCRLRRRLDRRDLVSTENGTYRLSPAAQVDVRPAEDIVRGCRGECLQEEQRVVLGAIVEAYRTGGTARFERFEWFATTLARIHDVVCGAANLLARDALLRGAYDECIDRARTVLAIDPFDDDANGALIQAHLARGELGAGRRQFRRYAAVLADEFRAVPPQGLAELVR
jgi:DNA-binding SARP family transcriptional activator